MPKFNEMEREIIRNRLYIEGEKLFVTHGVRKVTLNDLTTAAGISHGAFYAFFDSKEQLFMEINLKKQGEIFAQLEVVIGENKKLKSRELVKIVMSFLIDRFFADSLISSVKGELWEYLSRRLPPETIESNNISDSIIIEKLTEVGVKFNCHTSLVVKIIQAVFMGASSFTWDEENKEVIDILMDSVIEKIVEE